MNLDAADPAVESRLVDPFSCRMWNGHYRLQELVTEDSCREEIRSIKEHGQKHPVLCRELRGDARHQYELIYGARRLFIAQHLNISLLIQVRPLTDAEAFIEMEVENRLRREISPYERGIAYKDWLRNGYFSSQKELARTLGVSQAHVCRLLRFADIPTIIVRAFGAQCDLRESWALVLAERCEDPGVRMKMIAAARSLTECGGSRDPAAIFKLLLDCQDPQPRTRGRGSETVVRSASGKPLFRISYRNSGVHIVVPNRSASSDTIESVADILRQLIEQTGATAQAPHSMMKSMREVRPRALARSSLPRHAAPGVGIARPPDPRRGSL